MFGGTFLPSAARAYRALTTARAYRALSTARAYRALTTARAYRALTTARVSSRADHRSRLSRAEHRSRPSRVDHRSRPSRVDYRSRPSRVDYHSLLSDEFLMVRGRPTEGAPSPQAGPSVFPSEKSFGFGFTRSIWPTRQITDQREAPTLGQSCDASLDTG